MQKISLQRHQQKCQLILFILILVVTLIITQQSNKTMFSFEKDQKQLIVSQIHETLKVIADADLQYQVLIGAGKINYSSVHNNDMVNGLSYTLDCVRGVGGCWHPQDPKVGEWIQLSFQNKKQFVGVVIQGRAHHDSWVKRFEVEYSNNGVQWMKVEPLLNFLQTNPDYPKYSFNGNNDRNTKVTHYFKKSVIARTVRILPLEFTHYPCLRFDFLTKA